MQKIVTIFPLLSTHTNFIDKEFYIRLLPIEDPSDPEEGLFLYGSSEAISYRNPEVTLSNKLLTPLGRVSPPKFGFSAVDQTNLSFVSRFINKQKDGVMFRFDIFFNLISEPLLLMRLFGPGDIFVTHAIPSGYESLQLSSDFEGRQKFYFFNQDEIPIFKGFFQSYWRKFRTLETYTKQQGSLARWSKQIGNALYFFNRSYFTKTQISSPVDSRKGNIDRLMALITALDALFGMNMSDGKALARNAGILLKPLYKDAEKNIQEYYGLRSNWVHANETKMTSHISDRQIETLSKYVQKACLTSLELFCDEEIRKGFLASKRKHFIEYASLVPKEVDKASATVKGSGQIYDKWDN